MREQNPVLSLPNEFTHTSIWEVGSKRTPQDTKCNFQSHPASHLPSNPYPHSPALVPAQYQVHFPASSGRRNSMSAVTQYATNGHMSQGSTNGFLKVSITLRYQKKVFSLLLMKSLHNGVCYGLKRKCF